MIKAVMFDFDGVLIDSFEMNLAICREQGKDVSLDTFKDHHNGNVYEKPAISFTEEEASDFFRSYYERISKDLLFPIADQVQKLSKKYALHVVSSNSERNINRFLDLTGLAGEFSEIAGMETEKSKIRKFEQIFEKYQIKPPECVFVSDTLGDILEGRAAGLRTIAVAWGYHDERRLHLGEPDQIIREFERLGESVFSFDGIG